MTLGRGKVQCSTRPENSTSFKIISMGKRSLGSTLSKLACCLMMQGKLSKPSCMADEAKLGDRAAKPQHQQHLTASPATVLEGTVHMAGETAPNSHLRQMHRSSMPVTRMLVSMRLKAQWQRYSQQSAAGSIKCTCSCQLPCCA